MPIKAHSKNASPKIQTNKQQEFHGQTNHRLSHIRTRWKTHRFLTRDKEIQYGSDLRGLFGRRRDCATRIGEWALCWENDPGTGEKGAWPRSVPRKPRAYQSPRRYHRDSWTQRGVWPVGFSRTRAISRSPVKLRCTCLPSISKKILDCVQCRMSYAVAVAGCALLEETATDLMEVLCF